MSVEVLTFGCRLNAVESEAMRGLAERAGHRGAVLVNTCAVTAEAEKQARKAIRAAHRRNPAAPILVTGCAAQIAPERWGSLLGVARVIPNPDKLRPEAWTRGDPPLPEPKADPATPATPAAAGPDTDASGVRGAAGLDANPSGAPSAFGTGLHPSGIRGAAGTGIDPDGGRDVTGTGVHPSRGLGAAGLDADSSGVRSAAGTGTHPSGVWRATGTEINPGGDRGAAGTGIPPSGGRGAADTGIHPSRDLGATRTDPGSGRNEGAGSDPRVGTGVDPGAGPSGTARTRAFLQIQGGCDHACTFCVIPRGRGPSFSVPAETLAARLRDLVERGHKEAVLTGVDIASYGADLPGRPSLGAAVRRLLALVPELPRLRLSSLDPAALDDELWRLLAEEPRLMPHLHLSLQHGAELILKRMKRRHGRADALAAARRAQDARPGIALGADLIAGFPTETEAHLRDTLDLVEEMGLSFLHVFPYSERPGTPAARMPPVPVPLRRERAARLREAGAAAAARFYAGRVGREETVLFEAGNRGHTEHFAPLRLPDTAAPVPRGALRRVRATAAEVDGLLGAAGEAR